MVIRSKRQYTKNQKYHTVKELLEMAGPDTGNILLKFKGSAGPEYPDSIDKKVDSFLTWYGTRFIELDKQFPFNSEERFDSITEHHSAGKKILLGLINNKKAINDYTT